MEYQPGPFVLAVERNGHKVKTNCFSRNIVSQTRIPAFHVISPTFAAMKQNEGSCVNFLNGCTLVPPALTSLKWLNCYVMIVAQLGDDRENVSHGFIFGLPEMVLLIRQTL